VWSLGFVKGETEYEAGFAEEAVFQLHHHCLMAWMREGWIASSGGSTRLRRPSGNRQQAPAVEWLLYKLRLWDGGFARVSGTNVAQRLIWLGYAMTSLSRVTGSPRLGRHVAAIRATERSIYSCPTPKLIRSESSGPTSSPHTRRSRPCVEEVAGGRSAVVSIASLTIANDKRSAEQGHR
jgi:hypothetical protein